MNFELSLPDLDDVVRPALARGTGEKLATMKLTLGMEIDELKGIVPAVNDLSSAQDELSASVEAMGEKVDQAVSSIEIDGALLSMAEAASPRSNPVRRDSLASS